MVAALQQARANGYSDEESTRFVGWGTDRWLAAHTYDALNQNTLATGNWKKGKTPEFQPFPTPLDDKPASLKKAEKKSSALHNIFSMLTGR